MRQASEAEAGRAGRSNPRGHLYQSGEKVGWGRMGTPGSAFVPGTLLQILEGIRRQDYIYISPLPRAGSCTRSCANQHPHNPTTAARVRGDKDRGRGCYGRGMRHF